MAGWVAPTKILENPNFVAVDFETANRISPVSACSVALVRVSDGEVVDRFSSYIKPPVEFSAFQFTYLHGISAQDVADAPMWPNLVPGIKDFVGNLPVYAHNAAFDANVWLHLDQYFGTHSKPWHFYCSYRTAKELVPGLENYQLPTVAKALVPSFQLDHHKADSDAEACALIVAALQQRCPVWE